MMFVMFLLTWFIVWPLKVQDTLISWSITSLMFLHFLVVDFLVYSDVFEVYTLRILLGFLGVDVAHSYCLWNMYLKTFLLFLLLPAAHSARSVSWSVSREFVFLDWFMQKFEADCFPAKVACKEVKRKFPATAKTHTWHFVTIDPQKTGKFIKCLNILF